MRGPNCRIVHSLGNLVELKVFYIKLIAVVFQNSFPFKELNVVDYLYLLGSLKTRPNQSEDEFKFLFRIVIHFLQLEACLNKTSENLTALEQVKLSIALALLSETNVLLMDFPSYGLDKNEKRQLWILLIRLRSSRRAILLTTSSIEEAEVSVR